MTTSQVFGIIAISLVGIGTVLFVIGLFLPKGFGAETDLPWFKWLTKQIQDCLKIIRDPNASPRDRVTAGGLLLIFLGILFFLVSLVLGIASPGSGGGGTPTPTPTPTAT